jgi:hypothetical protein
LLTGNAGTQVGTNFIGTTDAHDFAVYTNAAERMRVAANGQVVIDSTAARYSYAMLSVFGNATQTYAINAYSPGIGLYSIGSTYGTNTRVNNATGWPLYAKNQSTTGYGTMTVGSNIATAGYYSGRSAGLNSWGNDGVHAYGAAAATGIGIMSAGNNLTPIVLAEGAGGTFKGYWGSYSRSSIAAGTGIIGAGNNQTTTFFLAGGSGGAFTGYDGLFGKGILGTGTGVIGLGNGIASAPTVIAAGSGGAFTGTITGAGGWGGTNGLIGWATTAGTGTGVVGAGNNLATATLGGGSGGAFVGTATGSVGWATSATGTGVIGAGNNAAATPLANGSGGAFAGNDGVYGKGNSATGTGVIGAGNNLTSSPLATGSGGAFTGTGIGDYGKATNATGTGVVGLGNNIATATTYASGSGGAFTGTVCGVAGYASAAGSTSYGVYGSYTGGGNNDGVGVYGYSWPNSGWGIGVYGMGRKYGVYYSGGLAGTGTKSFIIDHPLDPENKILKHFAIESPEVLNMYRGNVVLNGEGEATIQLPDYFMSININFSYNLTPVGRPAPGLFIKNEINENGEFTISGGNPNQKISWVVYAERNDLYMQQEGVRDVVINKDEREKGKYLMPNLYNQPPEKGIYYMDPNKEIQTVSNQEISYKKVNGVEQDSSEVKQLKEMPVGEVKIVEDELTPGKAPGK